MRLRRVTVAVLLIAAATAEAQSPRARAMATDPRPEPLASWVAPYAPVAAQIIGTAYVNDQGWQRLATLTDRFGARQSGSAALEQAIAWAADEMRRDGLEQVHTEPVMVPRWVRGQESAELVAPSRLPIVMLGLGNSVGTPAEGIEADVLVVRSWTELEAAGPRVRGHIVLFNVPFTDYGAGRPYRSDGPSRAARLGAVATLVRSVGPDGLRLPHTGAMQYADDAPRIPAAAIASEDADRLQRLSDRGERIVVRLRMDAHAAPAVPSFNVVGEIVGRESPEQVVVVGGHLDSWDVGAGASDDGGGVVAAWEALRLMRALGLRPRRTVRVVLFTDEENGGSGGLAYRDAHRAELAQHVMMLEADEGLFAPVRFGVSADAAATAQLRAVTALLAGIDASTVTDGAGGADVEPSVAVAHMPNVSYDGSGAYFLLHHTPADTVDKIAPADVSRASAALAVIAYVVADLPTRLGAPLAN